MFAVLGFAIDGSWHHYLRQFYIGPPRALSTAGVYALWAGIWYYASHAGDWTHAAIARDQKLIPTAPVPDYDGHWDECSIFAARSAKKMQLEQHSAHWVVNSTLITVPVLAYLTYAYRPWFWQRRFPFKVAWPGMVGFTSPMAKERFGHSLHQRTWNNVPCSKARSVQAWCTKHGLFGAELRNRMATLTKMNFRVSKSIT